jgi:hypothetical protein
MSDIAILCHCSKKARKNRAADHTESKMPPQRELWQRPSRHRTSPNFQPQFQGKPLPSILLIVVAASNRPHSCCCNINCCADNSRTNLHGRSNHSDSRISHSNDHAPRQHNGQSGKETQAKEVWQFDLRGECSGDTGARKQKRQPVRAGVFKKLGGQSRNRTTDTRIFKTNHSTHIN